MYRSHGHLARKLLTSTCFPSFSSSFSELTVLCRQSNALSTQYLEAMSLTLRAISATLSGKCPHLHQLLFAQRQVSMQAIASSIWWIGLTSSARRSLWVRMRALRLPTKQSAQRQLQGLGSSLRTFTSLQDGCRASRSGWKRSNLMKTSACSSRWRRVRRFPSTYFELRASL